MYIEFTIGGIKLITIAIVNILEIKMVHRLSFQKEKNEAAYEMSCLLLHAAFVVFIMPSMWFIMTNGSFLYISFHCTFTIHVFSFSTLLYRRLIKRRLFEAKLSIRKHVSKLPSPIS
jgi:phosphatidylserine synthase